MTGRTEAVETIEEVRAKVHIGRIMRGFDAEAQRRIIEGALDILRSDEQQNCTFHRAHEPMCGRPPEDKSVHVDEDERMQHGKHIWRHE